MYAWLALAWPNPIMLGPYTHCSPALPVIRKTDNQIGYLLSFWGKRENGINKQINLFQRRTSLRERSVHLSPHTENATACHLDHVIHTLAEIYCQSQ
jgi:hypothetical protein